MQCTLSSIICVIILRLHIPVSVCTKKKKKGKNLKNLYVFFNMYSANLLHYVIAENLEQPPVMVFGIEDGSL